MKKLKRILWFCLWALAWCSVVLFFFWTAGEIYYFSLLPQFLTAVLAALYVLGGFYLFWKSKPKTKWLPIASGSIVLLFLVSLVQQPKTDRVWDEDQAKMPQVIFDGNNITIENFRSNVYRSESDYDAKFGTFEFQLDELTDVWFLVQRFTALEGLAHTFLTFRVQTQMGPRYFSVSVEIRREAGEAYSPIQGMYRQYELTYVVGDEKDLIGVRTVMRPEDRVFMYRANATPRQVQELFQAIATRANGLQDSPEFYNTFLNNCTNNIVWHTYKLTPQPVNWLDPRIVMPGFSDRFAFKKNLIGRDGQTFEELADKSRIDEKARAFGIAPGFSEAIRGN
jgi:hypothetical protein